MICTAVEKCHHLQQNRRAKFGWKNVIKTLDLMLKTYEFDIRAQIFMENVFPIRFVIWLRTSPPSRRTQRPTKKKPKRER